MVTVVQLYPGTGAARGADALGALAEGLPPQERDLLARALEFAEPLYAGELLSTGEPTWTHALGLGASQGLIEGCWDTFRRRRHPSSIPLSEVTRCLARPQKGV